jgi:hypothetical protein
VRGLGLAALALTGAIALFAAAVVLSFQLLSGDEAEGPSRLAPVELAGPEETVFSWNRDRCDDDDLPDLPARAFRDDRGRVVLIASHFVNRRFVGPELGRLEHPCDVIMASRFDADPSRYADREWLAAPYTDDGRTVYSLVHDEYQGQTHPGRCPSGEYFKCWYNSITLAVSRDGGRTFSHVGAASRHLVASVPYRYEPDVGPYGYFAPSNWVLNRDDGYQYAMIRTGERGAQRSGTCVMRTQTPGDPRSWRTWGGARFDVSFVDPYVDRGFDPVDHVCTPVSIPQIGTMVESLTYNEYFGRWLLVGSAQDVIKGGTATGFFYSLSDDLVHWSRRKLIHKAEFTWSFKCGDTTPVSYPSVLDPTSSSRNFDTSGRTPYLYFTRYHYRDCVQSKNRDLVRVPIRFSK